MGPLRFRAVEHRGFLGLLISCDGGISSEAMATLTQTSAVPSQLPNLAARSSPRYDRFWRRTLRTRTAHLGESFGSRLSKSEFCAR